jgi:hypothetical protein
MLKVGFRSVCDKLNAPDGSGFYTSDSELNDIFRLPSNSTDDCLLFMANLSILSSLPTGCGLLRAIVTQVRVINWAAKNQNDYRQSFVFLMIDDQATDSWFATDLPSGDELFSAIIISRGMFDNSASAFFFLICKDSQGSLNFAKCNCPAYIVLANGLCHFLFALTTNRVPTQDGIDSLSSSMAVRAQSLLESISAFETLIKTPGFEYMWTSSLEFIISIPIERLYNPNEINPGSFVYGDGDIVFEALLNGIQPAPQIFFEGCTLIRTFDVAPILIRACRGNPTTVDNAVWGAFLAAIAHVFQARFPRDLPTFQ